MNVLFVCKGNLCRSAIAEVLLRDMIVRMDLPVEVDSAGLATVEGTACNECACRAVAEVGLCLDMHVSKPINTALVAWADTVICMTEQSQQSLQRLYPNAWMKFTMLSQSVNDPCGQGFDAYRTCVQDLRVLLIKWISDQHFPGVSWKEKFQQNRVLP